MSNTALDQLNQNELIEAMHAHGIAPKGKYGAAQLIESDRIKAIEMIRQSIKDKEIQSQTCDDCGEFFDDCFC